MERDLKTPDIAPGMEAAAQRRKALMRQRAAAARLRADPVPARQELCEGAAFAPCKMAKADSPAAAAGRP